jgi:TrmH family RNA methyltransferase
VPTTHDSSDVPAPLTKRSGRVKAARALRHRKDRAEHRLFLAEGAKVLTEALATGGVVEVLATLGASEEYAALRKAVDEAGIPWHPADDDAVGSLSGAVTPQGIVAVCRFLDVPLEGVLGERVPEERGTSVSRVPEERGTSVSRVPEERGTSVSRVPEERGTSVSKGPLVICADVRDPGNAGTVIRTADAAGAAGVVLAGQSVDLYNDKTVRATVGSLWHLPVALHDDALDAVRRAQAAGYTVLAADGAGETDLFEAERSELLARPHAWLVGNEAWGLPDDLAALANHRVAIPIYGRAESLNLATAAAVCLYASARRRSGPSSV